MKKVIVMVLAAIMMVGMMTGCKTTTHVKVYSTAGNPENGYVVEEYYEQDGVKIPAKLYEAGIRF